MDLGSMWLIQHADLNHCLDGILDQQHFDAALEPELRVDQFLDHDRNLIFRQGRIGLGRREF